MGVTEGQGLGRALEVCLILGSARTKVSWWCLLGGSLFPDCAATWCESGAGWLGWGFSDDVFVYYEIQILTWMQVP